MAREEDQVGWAPWLAILITLMGGLLRVFIIGHKGLRVDESFSLWLSGQSAAAIPQWAAKIGQHPPLYYLLLHYWIALKGDTLESVRLLSALFGTATIPVIYLIGRRLSGAVMGLVAAAVLALSPVNIRFAQETSMVTCLAFCAAAASYALVRLLTDPRSVRPAGSQFREWLHAWRTSSQPEPDRQGDFSYSQKIRRQTGWRAWLFRHRWLPIQTIETDLSWVAFVSFSAAAMLSHNAALLLPVATNLFVLGLMLSQRTKKAGPSPAFFVPSPASWARAQLGTFVLWSPWLYGLIKQAGRAYYQEPWIPRPAWSTLVQVFRSFLSGLTSEQTSLTKVIWILSALVLCLGLVHYLRRMPRFLFLAALIAVPFLGALAAGAGRPISYDRALIWTTIPLYLLLAAGIVQLRLRAIMIVVLMFLGANYLFSAGDYYRSVQREDWHDVAGFVANNVQKGDLILFNATWLQIPFDYYFKDYEEQYLLQVEQHGVPVDMFGGGVPDPKMTAGDIPRLISLLGGRKRAWLVYGHNWHSETDPEGLIPQTLAFRMSLIQERDYYGVQVRLYGVP